MKRQIRSPRGAKASRTQGGRMDKCVAEVPIFKPDPAAAVTKSPRQTTTDEDPSEDAVRRMVEAAYT